MKGFCSTTYSSGGRGPVPCANSVIPQMSRDACLAHPQSLLLYSRPATFYLSLWGPRWQKQGASCGFPVGGPLEATLGSLTELRPTRCLPAPSFPPPDGGVSHPSVLSTSADTSAHPMLTPHQSCPGDGFPRSPADPPLHVRAV